jgi:hypothetical protein
MWAFEFLIHFSFLYTISMIQEVGWFLTIEENDHKYPWHHSQSRQCICPMYFRSYLEASVSIGAFSDLPFIANTSFCQNSSLSLKFILSSKQTCPFGVSSKGFTITLVTSIFRKKLYGYLIWSVAWSFKGPRSPRFSAIHLAQLSFICSKNANLPFQDKFWTGSH